MKKNKKSSIEVPGTVVNILAENKSDYICLTDIARHKNPQGIDDLIRNWLRNRNTVEFLGVWEQLHNPNFNYGEFTIIKSQAGLNSYKISVKEWVEKTHAIGLKATPGRYGGTFAHKDIAFEFGRGSTPSPKSTSSKNSSASETTKALASQLTYEFKPNRRAL